MVAGIVVVGAGRGALLKTPPKKSPPATRPITPTMPPRMSGMLELSSDEFPLPLPFFPPFADSFGPADPRFPLDDERGSSSGSSSSSKRSSSSGASATKISLHFGHLIFFPSLLLSERFSLAEHSGHSIEILRAMTTLTSEAEKDYRPSRSSTA